MPRNADVVDGGANRLLPVDGAQREQRATVARGVRRRAACGELLGIDVVARASERHERHRPSHVAQVTGSGVAGRQANWTPPLRWIVTWATTPIARGAPMSRPLATRSTAGALPMSSRRPC